MGIRTACERVQPYCAGINAQGELVWEGREMPRWQMEMFRIAVDFFAPFMRHWLELRKYESEMEEFRPEDGYLAELKATTPGRLNEMRRMYPRRQKSARRKGDQP